MRKYFKCNFISPGIREWSVAMAVIWLATFLVLILSSFLKNHGVELSI